MGELVVAPAWRCLTSLVVGTLWVGGRDQPKLVVQDVDQVGKLTGAVGIRRLPLVIPLPTASAP